MAGLGWQELAILLVIPLLYVGPGVWIYRDAERRGGSAVGWLIVWLITGVVGLVIYLIVRPRRTVA